MATFLLLPPRERIEHELTVFWARTFRGHEPPADLVEWFCERLGQSRPDAYLVHREDLPGSAAVVEELVEYFGATPGDVVIAGGVSEVVPGR